MSDIDLSRFVAAQAGGVFEQALSELRAGRKRSHWMWFIFPQLAGLGRSSTAQFYALSGLDEAGAYAADPVLGPRLRLAAQAAAAAPAGTDAEALMGGIDALKLRSSMTLFVRAVPAEPAFHAVLDRFWDGAEDPRTLELLGPDQPTNTQNG